MPNIVFILADYLDKDECESTNLIEKYPEIAQKMYDQLCNILGPDINLE